MARHSPVRCWALLLLCACVGKAPSPPTPVTAEPLLDEHDVSQLLPPAVSARGDWARDVLGALGEISVAPHREAVCAVLAVIQQESGFQANPAVPELATIVRRRLDEEAQRLGPLGWPAFHALLGARAAPDQETFEVRLGHVHTERDVDRVFRDLLAYEHDGHPILYGAANLANQALSQGSLEDLNPITTAGSMQVSVQFAERTSAARHEKDLDLVRESLYERAGGVRYGTARLLGYAADYPRMLYRFADYNSGMYSSRNAAVQMEVGKLLGRPLVADGDLLSYDRKARPLEKETESLSALLAWRARFAPELSEARLREDVRREKEPGFAQTATYHAVRASYERVTHQHPPDAQMPEVVIRSPKMKHERSTRWYAESVDRKFQQCVSRARGQESLTVSPAR